MSRLADRVGGEKRVIGGPFGSNLTQADYTFSGVPVIRGGNMEHHGRWIGGQFAFVSAEKADTSLRSNLARPGDIVVTQRGTLGQVSIIPEATGYDRFVISQSQMAVAVDRQVADRDFVYYYLKSPEFAEYLTQATIQVGVPHINLGVLREAPANWPDVRTQAEISAALRQFDDKMELNRRMNETLEAMAQAIFRDWFVDFGPTRRKLAGATDSVAIMGSLTPDPKRAAGLSALFPDTLNDEGLPAGWEMQAVSDFAVISGGKQLERSEIHETGPNPVFGGAGVMGFSTRSNADGFVIVVGRVGAYCGQFFHHRGAAWVNNNASLVRANSGVSPEWLLLALRAADIDIIKRGAAQPFVSNGDIGRLPVVGPLRVTAAFSEVVSSAFLLQEQRNRENRTLAETRDYLLPRLMSGAVRVRDIEAAA